MGQDQAKILRTNVVQEILDVTSQTLRVWVQTLPPFCHRKIEPRKPKNYSAQDTLFLLVIKSLVRDIGIKISALVSSSENLLEVCYQRPLGELQNCWIRFEPNNHSFELLTTLEVSLLDKQEPIILIPLESHIDAIHSYLLGENRIPVTLDLPFPLQSVGGND